MHIIFKIIYWNNLTLTLMFEVDNESLKIPKRCLLISLIFVLNLFFVSSLTSPNKTRQHTHLGFSSFSANIFSGSLLSAYVLKHEQTRNVVELGALSKEKNYENPIPTQSSYLGWSETSKLPSYFFLHNLFFHTSDMLFWKQNIAIIWQCSKQVFTLHDTCLVSNYGYLK